MLARKIFYVIRTFQLFYHCSAFAGNLHSAVLHSDIPKFGSLMNNLTVTVGRDAVLTCVVENLSVYKVAWLRVDTQTILTMQNHVITKNHRIGLSNSDQQIWRLHIKETKPTDRGWYMCQINTEPMKSQIAYLDVVASPDILDSSSSSDTVVLEGSNVTLTCEAAGVPAPVIVWRREDGFKIRNRPVAQRNMYKERSALSFYAVSRKHSGVYMCIASNGVPPSVSKRMLLVVECVPEVYVPNSVYETEESNSLELHCDVEAYPKPEYYWILSNGSAFRNGIGLDNVTFQNYVYKIRMKLFIAKLTKSHFGYYLCISKNSLGMSEKMIKVSMNRIRTSNFSLSSTNSAGNFILTLIIIISVLIS